MTEPVKEQLSAFLDNELPKPEFELLLKRLGTDPELRGALERYVLIGESLRAPAEVQSTREFSTRVRAAVAREQISTGRPRRIKPLVGFAIAAGAAAVAIVVIRTAPLDLGRVADQALLQPATQGELTGRVLPTHAVPTIPPIAMEQPQRWVMEEPQRWRSVPAVSATQLTHYVVAHSEYSSPLERRNVLTGVLGEAVPVNDVIEIDPESQR